MRNIVLILLLAVFFAGCSKEAGGKDEVNGLVNFEIIPTLTGNSVNGEMTRAKVYEKFAANSQIGLSISNTDGVGIHQMYNNFYAIFNGEESWGYYLNGSYNGTMMSGYQDWGEITVMGYYPYNPSATDMSAIPFSIVTQGGADAKSDEQTATVDYLVAGSKTKNMNPGDGTAVELEFDHLMTSISFYWTRSFQGPTIKLSRVKFEIDGSRTFGVSGTYTAEEPIVSESSLNVQSFAKTITVNYTSSNKTFTYNTGYRETPLLIMPPLKQTTGADGADDATVTVTFYFEDALGTQFKFDDDGSSFTDGNGNPMFNFKLSDIDNGNGNDKGFLAGYNYRIQATIGTYVRFEGVPVVVEKDLDKNTPEQHIEI